MNRSEVHLRWRMRWSMFWTKDVGDGVARLEERETSEDICGFRQKEH